MFSLKKIRALWELMRLEHGLMIFIGILIGALITGKQAPALDKTIFTFSTALFLEAATFALNDYYDLDVDKKNNRLDRPLVRGDIKPKTAILIYLILLPLGILSSYMVNITCFTIAVSNAVIATLYDVKLKEIKVVSNFYIAFIMAIPFVFGATAISQQIPSIIYFIAFIAFLSGVAREIMKDVMDIEGDIERNTRSFPMLFGKEKANRIASFFYFTAIILSIIPFIINVDEAFYRDIIYLSIVSVTNAILLYVSIILLYTTDKTKINYCRKLSLIGIFIGLLAFLFGALL